MDLTTCQVLKASDSNTYYFHIQEVCHDNYEEILKQRCHRCHPYFFALLATDYYAILPTLLSDWCSTHMEPVIPLEYVFVNQMTKDVRQRNLCNLFILFLIRFIQIYYKRIDTKESSRLLFGYLLLFCGDLIFNELTRLSHYQIESIVVNFCGLHKSKGLTISIKLMKQWTRTELFEFGRSVILQVSPVMMVGSLSLPHHVVCSHKFFDRFYILGQVRANLQIPVSTDRDLANQYFVIALCIKHQMYYVILAALALSRNCYNNSQFKIGLKIWRLAHFLCVGSSSFPIWTRNWKKKRHKFKKCIVKLVCVNCGSPEPGLMSCTGCMKVQYCTRTCQKIHWNRTHRKQCNKIWSRLYQILKNAYGELFSRV